MDLDDWDVWSEDSRYIRWMDGLRDFTYYKSSVYSARDSGEGGERKKCIISLVDESRGFALLFQIVCGIGWCCIEDKPCEW